MPCASMFRLPSLVMFLTSVILGILLAFVVREYQTASDVLNSHPEVPHSLTYRSWLHSLNISFQPIAGDEREMTITEAEFLKQRVRVLCFVMPSYNDATSMLRYFSQEFVSASGLDAASAIMNTWGRRCNKIVFFGKSPRVRPPGLSVLELKENHEGSWGALREAFIQVAVNYQESFDWFLKVDLETYVVMENLRYYLSVFDPTQPYYFGHAYSSWGIQYNTGEAGFVLSSGAIRKLHNVLSKGLCESSMRAGDVILGQCLSDIGILPFDTRDSRSRGRFLPSQTENLLVPQGSYWGKTFWKNSRFRIGEGPECCSDFAVTFHALPNNIYILEYLIYHLKPFGISASLEGNNPKH